MIIKNNCYFYGWGLLIPISIFYLENAKISFARIIPAMISAPIYQLQYYASTGAAQQNEIFSYRQIFIYNIEI